MTREERLQEIASALDRLEEAKARLAEVEARSVSLVAACRATNIELGKAEDDVNGISALLAYLVGIREEQS